MTRFSITAWFAAAFLVLCGAASAHAEPQSFAGSAACAECHAAETEAWTKSDHGWALREPSPENVLGDFSGITFTNKDVTSRFFQRDGRYFVETDGKDGKLKEFEVRYAVGVRPLQQYLVETEGGRLQALDTAWDTENRRWYHLYPNDDVAARNGMHWTGSYKNWQARCADCHQTGFDKGLDAASQSYKSHWSELTVSCESCHGPASDHVAAARKTKDGSSTQLPKSLMKLGPSQQANELAACGPCHSRREAFSQQSAPVGATFADHYNLMLLRPNLYFGDGQQQDEVFILGSFLQSKMKAKGVTCSNCHEPHGGKLVAEGNAVCTQCHSEAGNTEFPSLARRSYDTPTHHHHKADSEAAQCVTCHMPDRAYMVTDKRRDHFFRMPDPLQSKAAGSPDACTTCHTDKTAEWANAAITGWFPQRNHDWQDRSAFIAFNGGDRTAATLESLKTYALNLDRPAIVRATAASLLADAATDAIDASLMPLLQDPDPLVRNAAIGLTRYGDPARKIELVKLLLSDPVRAVRQAAAAELAASDRSALNEQDQAAFGKALKEYMDSRAANADMPEAHLALGGLALSMRRWNEAEAAFSRATDLDPQLEQAWLTLARLKSALGDEQGAEAYLQQAMGYLPSSIALLIERGNREQRKGQDARAIGWYRRIIAIDPSNAEAWLRIASSALRARDIPLALEAAGKAMELQPDNTDGYVLAAIGHYIQGDRDKARDLALRARAINPGIQLPQELDDLTR
ncbi:multiheme c-type cytochrome [Aestuariivirga sp.]|uniref:multiheme c-type cytochrome n=1 Tax=Aestuariivirga sp. TaxID=2650926 RepID=UPI003594411A